MNNGECEDECICTFVHLVGNPNHACLMCGCPIREHPPLTEEDIDLL